MRNHPKENPRPSRTGQDPLEVFVSIPVDREKDFKDASTGPTTTINNSERSKHL